MNVFDTVNASDTMNVFDTVNVFGTVNASDTMNTSDTMNGSDTMNASYTNTSYTINASPIFPNTSEISVRPNTQILLQTAAASVVIRLTAKPDLPPTPQYLNS